MVVPGNPPKATVIQTILWIFEFSGRNMLLQIALLVIAGTGRQDPPTRFDIDFGMIDRNYRSAEILWAYFLVDPCQRVSRPARHPLMTLCMEARPSFRDLLKRMDRPIVEETLGDGNPLHADVRDDLAAGIAFWTLQWRADAVLKGNWESLHKKAEYFLLRASHEGDIVQQSFASLAYAYCPFRAYGDHVAFLEFSPGGNAPEREARLDEHRKRLIDTYSRFRSSVPERALRAAYELSVLASDRQQSEDSQHWHEIVKTEFKDFRSWRSGG